jgi:uncharacterized protein YjgD (DUF1641 family)
MAEPLTYQPKPPQIGPTAREELEQLLETLHEAGLLRLASDLAAGRQDIAGILFNGLNLEGSRYAVQNLAALFMVLAQIPPPRFYKIATTVKDALLAAADEPPAEKEAPGVRGFYKALKDDETWRALAPLMQGLMALGEGLRKPAPEKPISALTGKPSNA